MAINSEYAVKILETISEWGDEFGNVVLVSKDGLRMHVHQVILAAVGNFAARLDDFEIVVDDLDGALLLGLVGYFYSGNINLNFENVNEYMTVAINFGIKSLQEKCADLLSGGHVTIGNCIDWYMFAGKNNLTQLHQSAFQVICEGFGDIPSLEMRKLSFEQFGEVLKADTHSAAEEIIFDRLVDWVEADEMDRAKHVPELLQHIRLKHIPHKALIEKVDVFCVKHNLPSFTKDECHERLLNPIPLCYFRFDGNRRLFETLRDRDGNFPINRFNGHSGCWENLIHIRTNYHATNDRPGIAFSPDKVFIFNHKSVEVFDLIHRTHEILPDMSMARRDFNPIIVGQHIYVFGGGNPVPLKECARFDTISKTWQVLKSMHVARCYYTVAAVGAFIFVAGGVHTDARNSIERYDPMKDEWIKVAMISSGVVYSLIEWKDRLYAIGSNKNVERYDVERNEWEQPDISEMGDGIMSSILKLAHSHHNEHYKQWQILVRDKDYFNRYLTENAEPLSLENFTKIN